MKNFQNLLMFKIHLIKICAQTFNENFGIGYIIKKKKKL